MYAKLMSRITESSLMEEDVPVRYVFMMMLAIADPEGYVVGTDVAIARRMNISVNDLQKALVPLMSPDPNSNSKEHDGKRIIDSDCERGYFVVNYRKYRDTRDEEQRREYMRDYMRKYRAGKGVAPVNKRKPRKPRLAQEEAEVKEEVSKRDLAKPDSEQSVIDFCESRGLPKSDGTSIWNKWLGNGFKNGGNAIKDWRATIISWQGHGYLPSQKNGTKAPQGSRFPTPSEKYAEAVRKNPNHL